MTKRRNTHLVFQLSSSLPPITTRYKIEIRKTYTSSLRVSSSRIQSQLSLLPRQQPLSFFLPCFWTATDPDPPPPFPAPRERPVLRTVSPTRLVPQSHKCIGNENPRMGSQHNTTQHSTHPKHVLGYLRIRSAHAKTEYRNLHSARASFVRQRRVGGRRGVVGTQCSSW
jgi:hypothetical protein